MEKNEKVSNLSLMNSPVLHLHWNVFEEVVKTIGSRHAESGGAIGGNDCGNTVSHFHFDMSSHNSAVTYSPDYKLLNRLFKSKWNPEGVRLRGFIHSHPGLMGRPSCGDEVYAERILQAIDDLDCLWLPIVNTVSDTGIFRMTPWVAYRRSKGVFLVKGKIQVMHVPEKSSLKIGPINVLEQFKLSGWEGSVSVPLNEVVIGEERSVSCAPRILQTKRLDSMNEKPAIVENLAKHADVFPVESANAGHDTFSGSFDIRNTFNRVQDVYDLSLMRTSRIIAIGAGGAADWLEAMARTGIGQFVMIDPDVVSETNLATQQTYRKDIGRPKVDCIAERIRDINPTARIIALQKSLDDLDDEEIRRLALDPINGQVPGRTLICGLTDNFFAQARVNRIALQFGLPSLCAQVYREGRGAEITFTYPGVTPGCHRCVLSSRYRYFLEQEQENDVTSHGTPIFATTRLNAIKGFLTLALLHHGSRHPRWGSMLSRIGKRNLVQLRMDPDFAETLGMKVFDCVFEKADRDKLFFDEVVWLPQDQECPQTGYHACPDCGGTGDLRDAIGKFTDTKLIPSTKLEADKKVSVVDVHKRLVVAEMYIRQATLGLPGNGGRRWGHISPSK